MTIQWTKTEHGYMVRNMKGKVKYQHRLLAEQALGRELSRKERLHHIDGDKTNNENTNLVICPDDAYHQLLHKRQKALDECGNADWLKCCYCLEYDKPENLRIYKTSPPRHGECNKAYWKKWYQKRRLEDESMVD